MSDLTQVLAVYGAILSTISIILATILAIREIRKGRRRIRLTCRQALSPVRGALLEVKRQLALMVEVKVVNLGYRPIELEAAGLRMSDGSMYMKLRGPLGRVPLPAKLEDHDKVEIFFEVSAAQEELKEREAKVGQQLAYVDAVVVDAEGKQHTVRIPPIEGLTVEERPWWQFWKS